MSREKLDAMYDLVVGQDWKECGKYERKYVTRGLAWFKRCCDKRMSVVYAVYRDRGAGKFPIGSRGAKMWWLKDGWRCEKCGYSDTKPAGYFNY